jgi:hypothetical protein
MYNPSTGNIGNQAFADLPVTPQCLAGFRFSILMESTPRLLRSPIFLALLGLLLLLLVAYPKPGRLIQHVQNLIDPPIHPQAVSAISTALPDDPEVIESWVFEAIQRDANDYANWGVIFYFASPEEVLNIGRGACYARAIVLASILQAKSIPFRLYLMPGHMWVDYAGREPYVWGPGLDWIENPTDAMLRWEAGSWRYQGSGWIKVLPAMGVLQFQLYWRIVPFIGKLVIAAVLLFMLIVLSIRVRRRFSINTDSD